MSTDAEALKRLAALRAVEYVRDGMTVGLGTGTTARYAIEAIGQKISAGGFQVTGIPTSDRTAEMARSMGITLTTLEDCPQVDVTIDGADEIELSTLNAIKGHGGALLHEKLVAISTREETLIVDESKIVSRLGEHNFPIPVEVVAFGWSRTARRLEALDANPQLRTTADGSVYITDSGNYLLDCHFAVMDDPASLASLMKAVPGVIEHGLFIGLVARVVIAGAQGVRVVEK